MPFDMVFGIFGILFTFLTYVVYVTSRFSKLESEVKFLRDEVDDFHEIKQMVYKIHAQNELLLSLRTTPVNHS